MSSKILVESWRGFLSEGTLNCASPKIGIVTTTKNPLNLQEWISYHKNAGVDKIIIFFDDMKNDISNIKITKMFEGVHAYKNREGVKGTHYNRQVVNCQRGVDILIEMGCDWVFHIDDDEIIYSKSSKSISESIKSELMPDDTHVIRIQNYENLRTHDGFENYNYFKNENFFVERGLLSYGGVEVGGGKSGLNTRYSTFLYPDGVHFFSHIDENTNNHRHGDLIVLHYPHNVYSRFVDKCSMRGNTTCPWGVYKKIYEMINRGADEEELKGAYRKNIIYTSDRIQDLIESGREVFKFEMPNEFFIN